MVQFEKASRRFIQGNVNHHTVTDTRKNSMKDAVVQPSVWNSGLVFQCVVSEKIDHNDLSDVQKLIVPENIEIWNVGEMNQSKRNIDKKFALVIEPKRFASEKEKLSELFQKIIDNDVDMFRSKGLANVFNIMTDGKSSEKQSLSKKWCVIIKRRSYKVVLL